MARPDADSGSLYLVVGTKQSFSWRGGKKTTRILHPRPLSQGDFVDRQNKGFIEEAFVIGGEVLRISNFELTADGQDYRNVSQRTVAGSCINRDPIKSSVRYIPRAIASLMKLTRSSSHETVRMLREEIVE